MLTGLKFQIIIIAQQIALGMGYLHHRGIVHKDLKTKNIFLENSRAIIADFGLVNVARRLCSRYRRPGDSRGGISECMSIPAGWLCYLAPEVIRELRVHQTRGEDLPFTRSLIYRSRHLYQHKEDNFSVSVLISNYTILIQITSPQVKREDRHLLFVSMFFCVVQQFEPKPKVVFIVLIFSTTTVD